MAQAVEELRARKDESFNVIDVLTDRCTTVMRKVLFGDAVSDEAIYKMNAAYAVSLDGMTGVKLLLTGPVGK